MDPRQVDPLTVTPADGEREVSPADPLLAEKQNLELERAALRIQAAAVAAQQAALTEQELRLQQQQQAFDRQQEQLANHLDARRQRLLELQQRVQQSRKELRADQTARQQQVRKHRARWEQGQSELAEALKGAKAERRQLQDLRCRLKKRWHRQWAGERARLQEQERTLADRHSVLDRQTEELHHERAALADDRLRFNGEVEIGRRRLREGHQELRDARRVLTAQCQRDREQLDQVAANLGRLRGVVVQAQRETATRRRDAELTCDRLAKEADGLELRVGNLRRKMRDQEQECRRLQEVLAELRGHAESPNQTAQALTSEASQPSSRAAAPVALPVTASQDRERGLGIEAFALKLADDRVHLLEQCVRLLHAWECWHQDHQTAMAELARAGTRLEEREEGIAQRERALIVIEDDLHRRHEEAVQLHQHCESWQSRLRADEAAWHTEREAMLAKIRYREAHAERQAALIARLRERWAARRRQELEDLRTDRARCQEVQLRFAELCEESLRRNQVLEREARELAVRALSIEEYRLHFVTTSADAAKTERRLIRLRRRWHKRFATAERKLARDGSALTAAMASLGNQAAEMRQLRDDLSAHEQALDQDLAAWEHEQVLAEIARSRMEAELESHRLHRAALERQVGEERAEIERVTHKLLLEGPVAAPQIMRAA
jgi:hypothetical protein